MYQFKDPYIIDFANVEHYLDMHNVIREALDLPDYYGNNWDSLWDCLTDMTGRKMHIQIFSLNVIERKFGKEAKILIDLFKKIKHYENDSYCDQIIIEIINDNHSITLA